MKRKTVKQILAKKKNGQKIVMLTAYDYSLAVLIDRCGVDIILVGDSLANVVLGLEATREVGMSEMLHHAKAVNRGVRQALLVGDMPYRSYREEEVAVRNAKRFIEEAGCNAVKLEWFEDCPQVAQAIVKVGIPVMGHVGLTPQTANKDGGFKLQGRDASTAEMIIKQAKLLEAQGCFSIVLECIPDKIAAIITKKLRIPTIGIGAGPVCDGQVLVTYDMVGLFPGFSPVAGSTAGARYPKFVKQYANVDDLISKAVGQFRQEVENGSFPDREHSYTISDEEFRKLSDL